MSAPNRFMLSNEQRERLLSARAAWEEGEDEERLERLRQQEEDAETLRVIARLLAETGFAEGSDLTRAQMARLLTLVRALAPNPNLDARLLRRPGEPIDLNRDLRDLLYSPASFPLRLRAFLTRRHAGGQTALQFLCAVFPQEWPLVTRAGLRALDLSSEQHEAAIQEARERFDLPEPAAPPPIGESGAGGEGAPAVAGIPATDPILRLLADVVAYTAVREALTAADYLEVHRLLTQGLTTRRGRSRRTLAVALYAPSSASAAAVTMVRELETPEYESAPAAQDMETEADIGPPPDIAGISTGAVLALLERFVALHGFSYPPLALRDYFISLQTKPFAILTGVTGTGKTRLTSLFTEALTGDVERQYRLLPVQPDWADSTPLLGYVNLLASGGEGRFVSTPFLEFLRRAARLENAHRAFFLCLDEMNLARVEHYLAELLSAMETPTRELLLPDGQSLRLPANFFLTGTLNLDEATHALSRKVLDRANTLAFQEVYLREEAPEGRRSEPPEVELSPALRQAVFLQRRVTTVASARAKLGKFRQAGHTEADFVARVIHTLADANDLLTPHGLHFAYRVRDEVLCYCANSFDVDGTGLLVPEQPEDRAGNLQVALDLQIVQKVLPRFTGTREQIEAPVRALLGWAQQARFARTEQKLNRLLARLQRDGFAHFEAV